MGALEVGEFDDFEVFSGASAIGAIRLLLGQRAVVRVGVRAKGEDVVGSNDVLSVRYGEEINRSGLLLAGLVSDENDDLADAVNGGLEDGRDLPHPIVVITPAGVEKGVDGLFGGSGGGEVRRIDGREDGSCRGCGCIGLAVGSRGNILLCGRLKGGDGKHSHGGGETEKT